jgi:1,4-alpha-glucan branching enzyme
LLGAHPVSAAGDGAPATSFRVWAPAARAVAVVCRPDPASPESTVPMSRRPGGVWQAVVPDVGPGHQYQFQVVGRDGVPRRKADPYARQVARGQPAVSVVPHPSGHRWTDDRWLAGRRAASTGTPISIYEVHVGSWRTDAGYRRLIDDLVPYVRDRGFTHVELLPVTEHPYGGSWGYQVSSYFSPTDRFGSADDLRALVDRLHGAGVGVLLDWVPGHFAPDEWSLAEFDGGPTYEPADPLLARHPLWGTRTFDYRRPQVRDLLISSALYWLAEFHFDGLRVDAVSSIAQWDALREAGEGHNHRDATNEHGVAFLRELTDVVRAEHPDVLLIAEEAGRTEGVTTPTAHGGLGFDLRWDLGWAFDTFAYFAADPSRRRVSGHLVADAVDRAERNPVILPVSHDEVAPEQGSLWSRVWSDGTASSVRAFLALQWATPGHKLLFMGSEFGQPEPWREWMPFEPETVLAGPDAALHSGLDRLVTDLNRLYRSLSALHGRTQGPALRWWRRPGPEEPLLAFEREGDDGQVLLCVANLAEDHAIALDTIVDPRAWSSILYTADARYGGSRPDDVALTERAELAAGSVAWLVPYRRRTA